MRSMKIMLTAIFLAFAAFFSQAQEKNRFRCLAEIQGGSVFQSGSKITLKIRTEYPENYFFGAWRIFAYVRSLPADFSQATGFQVNHNKDPRWTSVPILPWKWLPAKQRGSKEIQVVLDSGKFPSGDYQLTVSTLFQGKNPAEKCKDVYRSAVFTFTLE